jgi:hypothetical protein
MHRVEESGKNYTLQCFLISTLCQILLGSRQGELYGWDM